MSVLDLNTDIKPYLTITKTDNDDRLQAALDAAEAMVADLVGPLTVTSVTERLRGGRRELLVSKFPIVALTSVTDGYGASMDTTLLELDNYGVVRYLLDSFYPWGFWVDYYTVTYTVGYATVPADLKRAIAALTDYLWTAQRGPTTRGQAPSEMTTQAPYTVPNYILQMLAGYIPLPSV